MGKAHIHERGILSDRREFLATAASGLLLLPIDSRSRGAGPREPNPRSVGPTGVSSASLLSRTAVTFLNALTSGQKAKASLPFEDAQRLDWHYIPKKRKGLPYKEMDSPQRHLADS